MSQHIESKVIKQQQIYRGKWLGMSHVSYTIGERTVNNYEKIFRTTSKEGRIDGIDIVPIIKYHNRKPEIIMIVEFRPPVKGYTLQFPTGMTESQDYQQNAKRELQEQTGYIVQNFIKIPMPVINYDPWKSNQTSLIYVANINGENKACKGEQKLQVSENISVVKFQINENLLQNIVEFCKKHSLHMQGKVYSLCLGIWLSHNLKSI